MLSDNVEFEVSFSISTKVTLEYAYNIFNEICNLLLIDWEYEGQFEAFFNGDIIIHELDKKQTGDLIKFLSKPSKYRIFTLGMITTNGELELYRGKDETYEQFLTRSSMAVMFA